MEDDSPLRPISAATPTPRGRVALVSMPWTAAATPSIQLAILAAALADHGIDSDRYELYLDYAKSAGLRVYKILGGQAGFIPEWIFSRHYYRDSHPDRVRRFRTVRPRFGLESRELEDDVLDALCVAADDFLDRSAAGIPWRDYAVVGFSLTYSQLGASMALARKIRQVAPETTIVFGGTACAGPMGSAVLRACPEADVVVSLDGEEVLPDLVRRLAEGQTLAGLAGVHWRRDGDIRSEPAGRPVHPGLVKTPIDYDPYFERLRRLDLAGSIDVWLPFEGSRGCWYGEKVQCTFCGLHEIMKFRSRDGGQVLAQLDDLAARYGIDRFFSVDLILPKEFHDGLLPALARRGGQWTIFYEVKADLTYEQFALLAEAGIRWIQPGIESLDPDILRLMRKGVRPSQNIQLLRWCKELGVRPSWNLITGIPRARPEMYQRMTALFPLLHHLPPPTGVGEFQLHRFSPYWGEPEAHGIEVIGAHPLFRDVFPIPAGELDELVHWHDFRLREDNQCADAIARLSVAADDWRRAFSAGAALSITMRGERSLIRDTRAGGEQLLELTENETALYQALSTSRRYPVIAQALGQARPGHGMNEAAIKRKISEWADYGVAYVERDRALALASWPAATRSLTMSSPHAYLE